MVTDQFGQSPMSPTSTRNVEFNEALDLLEGPQALVLARAGSNLPWSLLFALCGTKAPK